MVDFNPKNILENFGFTNLAEVNRENVNNVWRTPFFTTTLLEMVVPYKPAFVNFVPHLLSLGAEITQNVILDCHPDHIAYLLENSKVDFTLLPYIVSRAIILSKKEETMQLLIDYGAKISDTFYVSPDVLGIVVSLREYASQSDARVVSSRKALAALMILRKEAFFRASRDVVVTVAREMWAQKGPAEGGCGPRAHAWPKGKR